MRHTSIFFTAFLGFCLLGWAASPPAHAGAEDTLYTRLVDMSGAYPIFTPDDSLLVVTGVTHETPAKSRIMLFRSSDGRAEGFRDRVFVSAFTRDGNYAIGWYEGDGSRPVLYNWHTWETVVLCDSTGDGYLTNPVVTDDSKYIVAQSNGGVSCVIWDGKTGKFIKKISIKPMIESGQIIYETRGGIAVLADSKTIIFQYTTEDKVNQKFYHHAVSVDIESESILNYSHDCSTIYAIPGSNDVIMGHSPYTTLYCADGHSLQKKFEYPAYAYSHIVISFNQNPTYFLHSYKGGPLTVFETTTGKVLCQAKGGYGSPANMSNSKLYFATPGFAVYDATRLCITTSFPPDANNANTISPQPTSGILHIKDERIKVEQPMHLQALDMRGSMLSLPILLLMQQEGRIDVDVSALANGRYNLLLQQGGSTFSYPFILSK